MERRDGPVDRRRHRLPWPFIVVVLVATVVTSGAFYEANNSRIVSRSNHDAIHRLDRVTRQLDVLAREQAQFRVRRAEKTTATDALICQQLNKVKAVIRSVVTPTRASLLKVDYYKEHPDEIARAIESGRTIAAKFPATVCSRLPTAKGGANPKKKGP